MTDIDQSASTTIDVTLTVNGIAHTRTVEPRRLLSDFLRHDLRLTGTHVGCEHGVCGACTVLVDGKPMRLLVQGVGTRFRQQFDRAWGAEEARRGRLVVIGEKGLDQAAIAVDIGA